MVSCLDIISAGILRSGVALRSGFLERGVGVYSLAPVEALFKSRLSPLE